MFGFLTYVPARLTRRHLKSLAKHHCCCFTLAGIKMMLANLTFWKLLSKHHYCNEHFRMIFFFLSSFTNSSYTIFSVLTSFKIIQQIKPSQTNWGVFESLDGYGNNVTKLSAWGKVSFFFFSILKFQKQVKLCIFAKLELMETLWGLIWVAKCAGETKFFYWL